MSLRPGRVHVLGDVLFRALHVISGKLEVGKFEASVVTINLDFMKNYLEDQLFSPMWRSLTGERCKKLHRVQSHDPIASLPLCEGRPPVLQRSRLCTVVQRPIRGRCTVGAAARSGHGAPWPTCNTHDYRTGAASDRCTAGHMCRPCGRW